MSYESILGLLERKHNETLRTMNQYTPSWTSNAMLVMFTETVTKFCELADQQNTYKSRTAWYRIPSVRRAIEVFGDELGGFHGFNLCSSTVFDNVTTYVHFQEHEVLDGWLGYIYEDYEQLNVACSRAIRDTPSSDERSSRGEMNDLKAQIAALTQQVAMLTGQDAGPSRGRNNRRRR
jgi:hypothetical protein